ncbi:cytochrome c biogenesis protein CcsA [Novimethylophilus sp.]|uniref:cytochrome c biogenesis protein CcsA n=1 Tax=Novimethylophilus sp. TaxID=2137426 RepID=UPI002F3F04B3
MNILNIELASFWAALVGYSIATALALWGLVFRKHPERTLLALMTVAWGLHTAAIIARWIRIDHLPVGSTFEMLSANIWGLMAAVVLAYWINPRLRAFAAIVLPIIIIIMGWMIMVPRDASSLPPTYNTVWLFIHIGFIKLFLGSAFVALGIGGIVLLRAADIGRDRFARLPDDLSLDGTAYRCMALALIFDTLGIVAGAIWAQDAWGRYWSWDRLEVWSLITWLSIALTLHVRTPFRTTPRTNSILTIATFILAFMTFFGIPFVSKALHQGLV